MKASPKENQIFVFIIQHFITSIFCLFSRSEHAEHKRLHVSSQNEKRKPLCTNFDMLMSHSLHSPKTLTYQLPNIMKPAKDLHLPASAMPATPCPVGDNTRSLSLFCLNDYAITFSSGFGELLQKMQLSFPMSPNLCFQGVYKYDRKPLDHLSCHTLSPNYLKYWPFSWNAFSVIFNYFPDWIPPLQSRKTCQNIETNVK